MFFFQLNRNLIFACNRELRGVWPGAAIDYDRRTNRACMHLRIVESEKSEETNKSSVLNPHTSLKRIAEGAGKLRLFMHAESYPIPNVVYESL